jgi:hypothetical protein
MFEATERTLRVRRPDGHPAVGATVSAACVAEGQTHCDRDAAAVTWSAEPSSAAGLVRVLGLPRIPFTRLRIDVSWTHERDGVEEWLTGVARGIDLSAAQSPDPIDVVLAAPVEEHGPSSASGCGGPAVVEGPTAALALRVRYRDGAPARRVRIETDHGSTWTDADGRARFDALPVGRAPFVAFAHGFAPTRFEVEVGETATVDVVEVESRPVRVVVCDESGRPAPSALVLAKCGNVAWPPGGSRAVDCGLAQLDGDVEDVAPRTDRTGTVVLRVPRYRIDITASLGDATSWAWTDADEVVMTLREPDRTPPASAQVEDEASDEPR